jgi:hypothetical protein
MLWHGSTLTCAIFFARFTFSTRCLSVSVESLEMSASASAPVSSAPTFSSFSRFRGCFAHSDRLRLSDLGPSVEEAEGATGPSEAAKTPEVGRMSRLAGRRRGTAAVAFNDVDREGRLPPLSTFVGSGNMAAGLGGLLGGGGDDARKSTSGGIDVPKCRESLAARVRWMYSTFWSARRTDDAVESCRRSECRSRLLASGAEDKSPSSDALWCEHALCGRANMMGDDGIGTVSIDGDLRCKGSDGRRAESDLARCMSCASTSAAYACGPNVRLRLNAFFAVVDAVRILASVGDDGRSDSTSSSGGGGRSSSSTADGTGTSPKTRLSFRTLRISRIFSSSDNSFVVGGTGIEPSGAGDRGEAMSGVYGDDSWESAAEKMDGE